MKILHVLSGGPLDTDKVVVLFNDGPITLRHRMGQESKDVPAWLPVDGPRTARHGDRQHTIRQKTALADADSLVYKWSIYIRVSVVYVERTIFLRKGNILISQLLHRLMHMAVRYYKTERNGPRYLKDKVLHHKENKGLIKSVLAGKSISKAPTVSSKYFHCNYLNGLIPHLHQMVILLLRL
jgi:hypothetical protein